MATDPGALPRAAADDGDRPGTRSAALRTGLILVGLAALASIVILLPSWQTMVAAWDGNPTFGHGWVVLPIALFLAWRQRAFVSVLPVRPWPWALVGIAGLSLLWVVGTLAGVNAAHQFAAVGIVQLLPLLFLGPAIAARLWFPTAFLAFLVPFGDFLLEPMMDWTADFTVLALQATGIPVYREGLHFELPSGKWSVVEACSGLRYLIASVVLGTVYAHLSYRRASKQIAFVALAFVVPIVANWVRAYLIVMAGHLSGMKVAAGADHLVYGWVFFGLVMLVLFAIGRAFEDPREPLPAPSPATPAKTAAAAARWAVPVIGVVVAVVGARLGTGALLDATRPVDVARVASAIPGWQPTPAPSAGDFVPSYGGGIGTIRGRVAAAPGVDAWVAYYARQHERGEMILYSNVMTPIETGAAWRTIAQRSVRAPAGGSVAEFEMRGPSGRVLAWRAYRIGDWATASDVAAKLYTTAHVMLGRGDHSLAIVISTPIGEEPQAVAEGRERLAAAARAIDQGLPMAWYSRP